MAESSQMSEEEFRAIAKNLDEMVRNFENLPFPEIREQVFELLQVVDALHRAGLTRLVHLLDEHDGGSLVRQASLDSIAGTLLVLYDLIPEPAPPTAAPGTLSFIPLERIGRTPARSPLPPRSVRTPIFTEIARLEEVPPGTMKGVEADGVQVLVANVAGEICAVRNLCPGSVAPLSLGAFTPPVVVCPWHNEAFDVRTGKRADGLPGPGLDVLPITLQDGLIWLAVSAGLQRAVPQP